MIWGVLSGVSIDLLDYDKDCGGAMLAGEMGFKNVRLGSLCSDVYLRTGITMLQQSFTSSSINRFEHSPRSKD